MQKFLAAAPARFIQIVTSIEQCVPLNTLSVEDLVGRYKAYEERIRSRFGDPKEGEHLMLSRSQWEYFSGKKKNTESSSSGGQKYKPEPRTGSGSQKNEQSKDPDWKFDIKKVKCHNYGRKGHFKKDCKKPKNRGPMLQKRKMKVKPC